MSFELEGRDYEQITEYSELGFSWREIAKVLQLNVASFRNEWLNTKSLVRDAYELGKLQVKADLQLKKVTDARAGNMTMIQMVENDEAARHLQELKEKHLYDG